MTEYLPVSRRDLRRTSSITVRDAVNQKLNVMHAVILRDIRSRYFNHGLGFLIVPLLPVAHIVMLLGIYTVMNKQAEFGDDLRLFFATGLLPALTFSYLSRYMSASVVNNKSMTAFPIVRIMDIMLARAFLEFMGIVIALMIVVIFLVALGSNPVPVDPAQAIIAYFFTIVLGLGFGIIASVISAIIPIFSVIYSLSVVLVYLSSGAPIYLSSLPEQIVYACSWNPVFQGVEWLRSAYYIGYPTQWIDKIYFIGFAIGSVAFGLLLERMLRPFMLRN